MLRKHTNGCCKCRDADIFNITQKGFFFIYSTELANQAVDPRRFLVAFGTILYNVTTVPKRTKASIAMSSSIGSSNEDEVENLEGWEDVEPDLECTKVVSLFDDTIYDDVQSMLQYCKDTYNFDIAKVQKDLSK